jgi:hypothetical protein
MIDGCYHITRIPPKEGLGMIGGLAVISSLL